MGQSASSSLRDGGATAARPSTASTTTAAAATATAANKRKDESKSDVKRQVESDLNNRKPIYQLVNVKTGGGKLIEIIKTRARQHASHTSSSQADEGSGEGVLADLGGPAQPELDRRIDEQIRELVEPLLYNRGRGKLVPLARIWQWRLCGGEGGGGDLGANENSHDEHEPDAGQAPTGGRPALRTKAVGARFRWVCWKLEERGFVGETALHICFLLSSPSHMLLARRLLRLFPALINDIYTCDEYFGESSLHMAIVNEDVKIVKLLLDHGASVHERCLGTFFLPDDQKAKANGQIRRALERLSAGGPKGAGGCDESHQEDNYDDAKTQSTLGDARQTAEQRLDLQSNQFSDLQTNYEGYTYWGEYPLSFAASLGLADCYKLLLAKGANSNCQDSNGNSSLHICVLSDRVDMFDLCYSNGANLYLANKLGFTPLTLAAKLRRVNMFFHILTIVRQVNWLFCNVGFLDVPLAGIDSIDTRDGSCDDCSVLSIVVSGNSNEHLQMLDGLLSDLLQVKWATSIRGKFYSWLSLFILFLAIASLAYLTRFKMAPASDAGHGRGARENIARAYALASQYSELALVCCVTYYLVILTKRCLLESNSKRPATPTSLWGGPQLRPLVQAPELTIFTLTCLLILLCVPLRLLVGLREVEDFLAAIVMFLLPMKLLFFCRGSKSLGSFIVMIYKILVNDVLCFVVFLIVFIAGFGQSFVLIFKTYRPRQQEAAAGCGAPSNDAANNLTNFFESLVREEESYFLNFYDGFITLHMMALNEFSWVVDEFNSTDYPNLARLLFCVYMILVSILLINMLIAMLGKTYQDISSQPNENLRQWARALLTVERMCSRKSRLKMLDRYSHETVRAPGEAPVDDARPVSQRCYSSTRALSVEDLQAIVSIKQLNRENKSNSLRLAVRHHHQPTTGQATARDWK